MSNKIENPPYFDEEERQLMEAVDRGEFQSSVDQTEQISKLREAASNSLSKREVKSIRFYKRDLMRIRRIAAEKGMPYQTLIASIVHQYANGLLQERQNTLP